MQAQSSPGVRVKLCPLKNGLISPERSRGLPPALRVSDIIRSLPLKQMLHVLKNLQSIPAVYGSVTNWAIVTSRSFHCFLHRASTKALVNIRAVCSGFLFTGVRDL